MGASDKRRRQRSVFSRDGYTCRRCGSGRDLTLDHIRPKSHGGTDAISNLQTLCHDCNQLKADRPQHVFAKSAA